MGHAGHSHSEVLGFLRSEYLEGCIKKGMQPSAHTEHDEALAKLEEVAAGRDTYLANYARTALNSIGMLGMPGPERHAYKAHPKLPIAYGAKLAGYVEFIADAMSQTDFHLNDAVYLDESPEASFNGRAYRSEKHAGYFCMLDHGLFRLLHHLSLAAAMISNPRSDPGSEQPYKSDPGLVPAAASIVKSTFESHLVQVLHPLVESPGYAVDEGGILLASELTFAMKTFVVAHELAHIRLGHLESLTGNPSMSVRHEMEFEADHLAQETLIELSQRQPGCSFLLGGGIGFLLCDHIRIKVFCDLHGIRPEFISQSSDHPMAMARIRKLDQRLLRFFSEHPDVTRDCLSPLTNFQLVIRELQKG
jgi:hypothetical protein